MARNRIGLQFDGWEDTIAKLDKLGGTQAMKRGVESALKASKEYVNPQIESALNKLPAGGKYSTGSTKSSIDKDMSIEWRAMTGEIKVGFDFQKSGMTSIFLMYGTKGTPRHAPTAAVKGLYDAIYGTKTKKQIKEIQEAEVNKVIKDIMGG